MSLNKVVLDIRDLHVKAANKTILQGINLKLNPGEVHALMGPNGSGKSTLANLLARKEDYKIVKGSIHYGDLDLFELNAEAAAHAGIFLGFQYPLAIPGVSNAHFLRTIFNERRKSLQLSELDAVDFLAIVKQKMADLKMPEELLYRHLNDGFSGGEKKRNEILQMSLLEPTLVILDETDSGLDIDALKTVAEGINQARNSERCFLLITHYQRLLDYVQPDYVHILSNGKIVHSGDKSLVQELEIKGYEGYENHPLKSASAPSTSMLKESEQCG